MNGRKLVLQDSVVEPPDNRIWLVVFEVSIRNSSSKQKPYGTNPNSSLKKYLKIFSTFGNACNLLKMELVCFANCEIHKRPKTRRNYLDPNEPFRHSKKYSEPTNTSLADTKCGKRLQCTRKLKTTIHLLFC